MRPARAVPFVVLTIVFAACGTATDVGRSVAPSTTVASTSTAPTSTSPDTTMTTDTPTPPTTEPLGCAAAGLPPVPSAQDLPQPVAETRAAIVAAAVACDVDGLASLASEDFTYSFGGDDDPAAYWRDVESRSATEGDPSLLAILVRLLDLPFATIESDGLTYYVWPSAHAFNSWDAVPTEDRDALLGLYGAQDLADFASFGSYVGYRLGITSKGEWSYFVAGD